MKRLAFLFLFSIACTSSHGGDDAGEAEDDAASATSCDPNEALCDEPPPECPPFYAPLVESGCWGACVPNSECDPIPCSGPSDRCPMGWGCVGTGFCAPPR
jgi:hypothetical protein